MCTMPVIIGIKIYSFFTIFVQTLLCKYSWVLLYLGGRMTFLIPISICLYQPSIIMDFQQFMDIGEKLKLEGKGLF